MGKHIAFYINSLQKGGSERVFANLANYFQENSYKVTLVTQYQKDNEYLVDEKISRKISDLSQNEMSDRKSVV